MPLYVSVRTNSGNQTETPPNTPVLNTEYQVVAATALSGGASLLRFARRVRCVVFDSRHPVFGDWAGALLVPGHSDISESLRSPEHPSARLPVAFEGSELEDGRFRGGGGRRTRAIWEAVRAGRSGERAAGPDFFMRAVCGRVLPARG